LDVLENCLLPWRFGWGCCMECARCDHETNEYNKTPLVHRDSSLCRSARIFPQANDYIHLSIFDPGRSLHAVPKRSFVLNQTRFGLKHLPGCYCVLSVLSCHRSSVLNGRDSSDESD
jgi:hypothetical protein